ncbi:MAG TPA: response regulator transcription factor [Nocardioidaceae bacterium]|jgi:DNA-binding NarL/FixJ family response regulator
MVRVVVAEDNVLVRTGIETLLEPVADIDVVRACSTYDELMRAIEEHQPDVVLTDIRMPPSGTDEGIRAAVRLRTTHPGVGVVVLSQYLDPVQALTLVEDGSRGRGYLLKDRVADPGQLTAAIRAVAGGGSFIDSAVVDALISARAGTGSGRLARLTPREVEILGEIAAGRSNAAIAAALGVTDRAVEKHINSIFSKLGLTEDDTGVHRRVQAVLVFLGATN